MEIGISIGAFFLALGIHVILHRVLLARGVRSAKTFLVYALIGIGLVGWLPWSALLLYLLLSTMAFIFLITPVLGEVAPTSRILGSLSSGSWVSGRQILGKFTQREMVDKRLSDLRRAGMVRYVAGRWVATAAGQVIAKALGYYYRCLNWKPNI